MAVKIINRANRIQNKYLFDVEVEPKWLTHSAMHARRAMLSRQRSWLLETIVIYKRGTILSRQAGWDQVWLWLVLVGGVRYCS